MVIIRAYGLPEPCFEIELREGFDCIILGAKSGDFSIYQSYTNQSLFLCPSHSCLSLPSGL